ncbi:hypothetical protein EYF80_063972 [Liparis tanakae]|uniref:Uncharacterized protein n=1 Tax=Liparis tanakae TaxID=230148 RepID=A0A4Z2EC63_9TELE|nr:hypothetical protein EYF80_063972 [Liparis tanakae]
MARSTSTVTGKDWSALIPVCCPDVTPGGVLEDVFWALLCDASGAAIEEARSVASSTLSGDPHLDLQLLLPKIPHQGLSALQLHGSTFLERHRGLASLLHRGVFHLGAEGVPFVELVPEVAVGGALQLTEAGQKQAVNGYPRSGHRESQRQRFNVASPSFFVELRFILGHFPAQTLSRFNDSLPV